MVSDAMTKAIAECARINEKVADLTDREAHGWASNRYSAEELAKLFEERNAAVNRFIETKKTEREAKRKQISGRTERKAWQWVK